MKLRFAIALASLVLAASSAHAGDAAKGEKLFSKCKACHMVGENAKKRVGPPLNGVVDAPFGRASDFKYSKPLRELAAAGRIWDEATLDAYLTNPKAIVPRGAMSFPGLAKADQRSDIIAYLKQFAADGSKAP